MPLPSPVLGMRRGAGEIGAAIAAGRQNHAVGAEFVDHAIFQVDGHDAAASAFLVHDQVDGEIFDEKLGAAQALLIEGVQNRVAGSVGGGAGAFGRRFAVIQHVAAERPLIDPALLGAAKWHTVVLQLDHRRDGVTAHVLDGVLVTEPIGALDGVVHVIFPVVVLAHVVEGGANPALRGHRVTARREHLGDAGGLQAGHGHAQGGAQTGPTGADDNRVVGVLDDFVGFGIIPYPPKAIFKTEKIVAVPNRMSPNFIAVRVTSLTPSPLI